MADDLIPVLTRFHREVLLPDVKRIVGDAVGQLRTEMNSHFDASYQRFDRLETEYHMLVAGLKRVEERLDRVEARLDGVEQRLGSLEQKMEKMTLRSDLEALKARVEGLQSQIRILEERISA